MVGFGIFGIPVRVRTSFFVIAALLGFATRRLALVALWVGIVFVSILIHELGHALTARRLGSRVEIELNGVGGLTTWSVPPGGLTPGRRGLVAAAGSAVGVAFGLVVWLVAGAVGPFDGEAGFVVDNLIRVNVFWGLLNWLPIRPLDGGHLFTSLMEKLAPGRGKRIADVVFFLTAGIGLLFAIRLNLIFLAFLAGWLLWGEVTRLAGSPAGLVFPQMSYDESGSGENPKPAGESESSRPPDTEEPSR